MFFKFFQKRYSLSSCLLLSRTKMAIVLLGGLARLLGLAFALGRGRLGMNRLFLRCSDDSSRQTGVVHRNCGWCCRWQAIKKGGSGKTFTGERGLLSFEQADAGVMLFVDGLDRLSLLRSLMLLLLLQELLLKEDGATQGR
jgi:hypothetical protein